MGGNYGAVINRAIERDRRSFSETVFKKEEDDAS